MPKKLLIQLDLTDSEAIMYDFLSEDTSVLHIFYAQAKSILRKQLYCNYYTYKSVVEEIRKDKYEF